MALPATGSQISLSTLRGFFQNYPGQPGPGIPPINQNLQLSGIFGAYISPTVTTNTKLSATFGGWQNGNPTGASSYP